MSKEAEKYLKTHIFTPETTRAEMCEAYHQHRMKELLSELTDEKIRELSDKFYMNYTSLKPPYDDIYTYSAKEIREFIKGKQ